MQINNPFINQAKSESRSQTYDFVSEDTCTKSGISFKTLFLILLGIAAGLIVGIMFYSTVKQYVEPQAGTLAISDGQMASFVGRVLTFTIIAIFAETFGYLIGRLFPSATKIAAPIYSVGQGSLLGIMCGFLELIIPGISIAAGGTTAAIVLVTYLSYALGLRKHMRKISTFFLVYAITVLVSTLTLSIYTAFNNLSYDSYFAINLAVCVLYGFWGVLMLLLNFWEAEETVEGKLPKKYEWTVALGICYTIFLIFLYVVRFLVLILENSKSK